MNGKDCLLAFALLDASLPAAANDTAAVRQSFRRAKAKKIQITGLVCCCVLAAMMAFGFAHRYGKTDLPAATSAESVSGDLPGAETSVSQAPTETASGYQPGADPSVSQAPSAQQGDVASETQFSPATSTQRGETQLTQRAEAAYVVPRWEEKSTLEKYTGLEFGGAEYAVGRSEIAGENLGKALGEVTLLGYDPYADETHRVAATAYALKDIAPVCAVGIRFESGECCAYVNPAYTPASLFQLIDDLNLKNELRCGNAYTKGFSENGVYYARTFADFDDAAVWELLLNEDLPARADDESFMWSKRLFSVAVAVPALGYTNQGLWATEDGWLVTNLLETAKVFYIGPARAKAFADYLLKNVPYTQTSGVPEGETGVPE